MRVILASKSPRRKELLGDIFESFEIMSADADESLDGTVPTEEGVVILSERKGDAVYKLLEDGGEDLSDTLIISSDTLVELDGVPLGKPADREDAVRMLRSLSGKRHNVHTGVAVRYGERAVSGRKTTSVIFRELSREEIEEYVNSGEPMDKAGAYGIQGGAGKFVDHIEGDFDTVVGLSRALVRELCDRLGVAYDKK